MSSEDSQPGPVPAGDVSAHEVFERFTLGLIGLARRRLDARLQHKIEPEDVVQSAYKSFFLRYGEGTIEELGWQGLWGLLTCITLRKCSDRVRYHRAGRRDISREWAPLQGEGGAESWCDAVSREPTPEQAVVLAETVEQVLVGLNSNERSIIELSLQGYTTSEISQQLGRAERSVRRLRERVRKRLKRLRVENQL